MKKLLLKTLSFYQVYSSTKQARCRFSPTCSHYAQDAIESYGSLKGIWLSARRVMRCNPFGSFGIDPVPEKKLG